MDLASGRVGYQQERAGKTDLIWEELGFDLMSLGGSQVPFKEQAQPAAEDINRPKIYIYINRSFMEKIPNPGGIWVAQ